MNRTGLQSDDRDERERPDKSPDDRTGPVPMSGEPLSPAAALALQRAAGNRAVARLASRRPTRAAARGLLQRAPADTSPPPELDEDALPAYAASGGPVPEDKLPVDQEGGGVLARMAAEASARLARAAAQRRARAVSAPARSRATGGGRTLARYSGSAAAGYATKWAKATNSSYPRFVNDCTNFVSQSLLAGGWAMAGGSCSDRKSDGAWWYGDWNCVYPGVRASYTWSGAQNLYNFMSASGRGTGLSKVADLEIGDVLQMEFTADDPTEPYNLGHVGHSMVVTGKHDSNIYLSYHTDDHLNEPFWGPGGILSRHPTAKYYAWHVT